MTEDRELDQTGAGAMGASAASGAAKAGPKVAKTTSPLPRRGGIALNNGLILLSERYWGAAIRTADGKIVGTSGRKPHLPVGGGGVGGKGGVPLLRGLGRFGESLLVLGQVKAKLPQAQLPIQGRRVLAALLTSFAATSVVKTAAPKSALVQEAGGALAAFIPAVLAVKNSSVSGYHGAEHKVIGGLEAAAGTAFRSLAAKTPDASCREDASMDTAAKEHDRCGTNLIGPYLLATVGTSLLARGRSGEKSPVASALAGAASLGIAIEALRWATTHGDTMLARLMLAPGRTVQKRLTTSEPTEAQLEVGKRALAELRRLERAGD
jgi:uncharacterized protein YqhQ